MKDEQYEKAIEEIKREIEIVYNIKIALEEELVKLKREFENL